MTKAIAQITLARDSGLPEDVIVNTMHFEDDSGFGTTAGFDTNGPGLESRIATFYQALGPNLSSTLAGTATLDLYNWDDPKPRVPVRTSSFTFTPATTTLPGEVALCLSMRAARVSGQNAARRRGRIYLGPWSTTTGLDGTTPSPDSRPSTVFINTVVTAAHTMATGGSGSFRLAIFSPTTLAAGGSADDAWADAATIWVDNAWDTIRKRGARPSVRRAAAIGGTLAIVNEAA